LRKTEERPKREIQDEEYLQEMICPFCLEIMHQVVTVMPCLHNVTTHPKFSFVEAAILNG